MFSKMRFFSKEMFKLYLNVFLFHDLYALNVIFSDSHAFCTKMDVGK